MIDDGNKKIEKIPPLSRLAQWFFDCLFPKLCVDCKEEGEYWCRNCQKKPRLDYPSICFGCKKSDTIRGLCFDCQPRYAFDGLLIAGDYEEVVIKTLIRSLKYRFIKEMSLSLSLLLRKKVEQFLLEIPVDSLMNENFFNAVVVSIPLSRKRMRSREFNQAEILGKEIAHYCGLRFRPDLLFRSHRPPQAKLSEAERQENLKGSFFIKGDVPELIILVDDVITTGATLQESSLVLKQAGAQEIWALVVAKG